MQCIRPLKASFDNNGDITYNNKMAVKGLQPFEFDCRKCLPCRLNIAREKSIRCFHEAKTHENNIFLTLTYSEEHLKSPKLQYRDWQLFMKSLREKIERGVTDKELKKQLKITAMVTGEYGEKNKRPHWHAIIFNYRPTDSEYSHSNERGEPLFTSKTIKSLWKKGKHDFGEVTMDSASYVARYAAKKLVHGNDQDHDYHPLHKTPNNGMGKTWIQKHWKHTFENGFIVLPNGQQSKIPRYYVDWLKKNKPDEYIKYISNVRPKIQQQAEKKARKEEMQYISDMLNRKSGRPWSPSRSKVKETILKSKFKKLQEHLKL